MLILFGVATSKITSTLLFRALFLHTPVHSSFRNLHSSVSKPPFLRLETLISPHKILSLESQFCLRTDGTPRGLRKSLFEPSRLSTRLDKTTSILQLNSSNFEFNERSRWMSQKSVQNRDLFAQSFLSCRANARTYAEITSN